MQELKVEKEKEEAKKSSEEAKAKQLEAEKKKNLMAGGVRGIMALRNRKNTSKEPLPQNKNIFKRKLLSHKN